MAEPVVQQLSEALDKLEEFGIGGPRGTRGLPQLPSPFDEALLDHLAKGLRGAVRIRGTGLQAVPLPDVASVTQELRAAVALLEEWAVPE
jgi:hypothetical protein